MLEHGAGPVDGLVGAAKPGGRGDGDHRCPSPLQGGAVNFSTADNTDTDGYAPLFWRLGASPYRLVGGQLSGRW